jgi:hypothetical protein
MDIDFYDSLLGVFELNNTTIEVPSPMHQYFETLASDKALFNSSQPILAPIVSALNTKVTSLFPFSFFNLDFIVLTCSTLAFLAVLVMAYLLSTVA